VQKSGFDFPEQFAIFLGLEPAALIEQTGFAQHWLRFRFNILSVQGGVTADARRVVQSIMTAIDFGGVSEFL
jgi:hypothetical protein